MKTYAINEIFYTLQGEGAYAGHPAVFLRFAKCNLTCREETHGFDCDTEFEGFEKLTTAQITDRCRDLVRGETGVILVMTGGEPVLQIDDVLSRTLHAAGFRLHLETNGSLPLGGLAEMFEWITCSPKVAEHAVRLEYCHEGKYVVHGDSAIPRPAIDVLIRKTLSPAWGKDWFDPDALGRAIWLTKENPEWNLSIQTHKLLGVR
jgi:organic radical activating enzyme